MINNENNYEYAIILFLLLALSNGLFIYDSIRAIVIITCITYLIKEYIKHYTIPTKY